MNHNNISSEGVIVKSTGSWYHVRLFSTDEVWRCRIKGKFRLSDERITNPISVGDYVKVSPEKDPGIGVIDEILPRKNYVLRSSPRRRHALHLLACNVDQVVLVATIIEPNLKPGFIDRFILTSETYDIPICLIFNKADLYEEEELEIYESLKNIYEPIRYKTLLTSVETGQGIEELKAILKDKTSLVSGNSGVGKSSLTNRILPDLDLATQELSDYTGKGTHTTTFAEMYTLDFGGYMIDTPGIKELGFINLAPKDVANNYLEIFSHAKGCRFNNCLHLNEPDCAVKKAVENHQIHELRYQSYTCVMEEVQSQNHWERKTNW